MTTIEDLPYEIFNIIVNELDICDFINLRYVFNKSINKKLDYCFLYKKINCVKARNIRDDTKLFCKISINVIEQDDIISLNRIIDDEYISRNIVSMNIYNNFDLRNIDISKFYNIESFISVTDKIGGIDKLYKCKKYQLYYSHINIFDKYNIKNLDEVILYNFREKLYISTLSKCKRVIIDMCNDIELSGTYDISFLEIRNYKVIKLDNIKNIGLLDIKNIDCIIFDKNIENINQMSIYNSNQSTIDNINNVKTLIIKNCYRLYRLGNVKNVSTIIKDRYIIKDIYNNSDSFIVG